MEMIQEPQFITDNNGKRTFAIISIDRYNSFVEYEKRMEKIEDEEDLKAIEERKNEKSYLAEDVFREIRQKRNPNG